VLTEASMKLACRMVTIGAPMPAGRLRRNPSSASSTLCVSPTVSASGCLSTASSTAGWPL
jgi:hypothetical protein